MSIKQVVCKTDDIFVLSVINEIFLEVRPFDELYADGIEAYWNENWDGCIYYLESAFSGYRYEKLSTGRFPVFFY